MRPTHSPAEVWRWSACSSGVPGWMSTRGTVAVCVRVRGANGDRAQHVRTFGTTTAKLRTRRDWLEAPGATHVVLETTGVYWRPVFRALIGATRRGRAFDGRAGSAHGAANAHPLVRRPSPTQLSPP